MLDFNPETFLCPNCRLTLSYIVANGKLMGPTTRKVSHLTEHCSFQKEVRERVR